MEERYRRKATIITTNLEYEEWQIFPWQQSPLRRPPQPHSPPLPHHPH